MSDIPHFPSESAPYPSASSQGGSTHPTAHPSVGSRGGAQQSQQPTVQYIQAPSRSSPLGCFLILSLLVNVAAGVVIVLMFGCMSVFSGNKVGATTLGLKEKYVSGDRSASQKVAVVHVDGVILEGLLEYVHKQIDQVNRDDDVKAVVVRINSPGGSITASEDLHRRFEKLRDNNKNLVVSMGAMAASGGYYIAMPAGKDGSREQPALFAEKNSMTGSIGVYVSFPNVKELGDKYGFKMVTVKAGDLKAGGSPFKEMTPKEQQVWQDMVNESYNRFLGVVKEGRPKQLKYALLKKFTVDPILVGVAGEQAGPEAVQPYERYLADGGVFTGERAKEYGLVDEIGTLEDAIKQASKVAQLGSDYRAIEYQKPQMLLDLLGVRSGGTSPSSALDPGRLASGLSPRMWYLAPGHEVVGVLAATKAQE